MIDIQVIEVNISDLQILQKIGRQTFSDTFSEGNTSEDMIKYLDKKFSIEQLTLELNNNESEFYFAKISNEVVGYLKLNFGNAQTELKDDKAIEIERIYVLKEYFGKKVGQFLYDNALNIANSKNAKYIWLGVWEKNTRAIRFYEKNGFVEFDKHIFVLGDDEQTDIMMKLEL
ncbi:GNAT family N-acetyltransferase [Pseudofulvibacter geojedonensis]|uniref:GNAT family N-acetyltransferase n=1 Tax=Pseudofulvibacter geojedonensis TaxID=1123758 RepID=A0ABW3I3E2_9FLAO